MTELSSTQIGAIAENLVANELMIESNGRLSPFQPIADDDGLDVLIYDKVTGSAVPIQIKARTKALKKKTLLNVEILFILKLKNQLTEMIAMLFYCVYCYHQT